MIKISINKNILVIEFYEYIRNINKISVDIFTKIWERENYIKFMKIFQKNFKMTKISKTHILELYNITKLNL